MNMYNAWEIDAEAKRVLEAVGITDLNAPVDKVRAGGRSGGGQERVEACVHANKGCRPPS